MADFAHELLVALDRQHELMEKINERLGTLLNAVDRAEQEVPEYMRRFTMYYHDIIHINWRYEEMGLMPPTHIRAEMERSHDRMRHLLENENTQGGTFHRIRQMMDQVEGNKYKHSDIGGAREAGLSQQVKQRR